MFTGSGKDRLTVKGKNNCQMGAESWQENAECSTYKSSTGNGSFHEEPDYFQPGLEQCLANKALCSGVS